MMMASQTRTATAFTAQPVLSGIHCRNHHSQPTPTSTQLRAEKTKGVYVRPSGAIERGSGFFVPGLEGSRVRLAFGALLLILTGVNHALSSVATWTLPEGVVLVYSLLVLFQALIEFSKETKLEAGDAVVETAAASQSTSAQQDATANSNALAQTWSSDADESMLREKEKIQWTAATYIALTPATEMLLLSSRSAKKDGAATYDVVYRLGGTLDSRNDDASIQTGIRAAFEALSKSKSGRVALPGDSHPTALALITDESHRRSVILQRATVRDDVAEDEGATQEYCWLVSSDQLLAKYRKEDLRWLGQLAKY